MKLGHSHSMEIQPASHSQVVKANKDDWVVIESDLTETVKELKEIDPRLNVRYNGQQGFYALFAREVINGVEQDYLVNTFLSLDKRVVNRVREIMDSNYDYGTETERLDKKADAIHEAKIKEVMGDNAERLAFAIRKDLGVKDKAFF